MIVFVTKVCRLFLRRVSPLGSDDHVAFGLAVVAHALHAVDLGQVVDDLPVFSVHGWETVAPLWLFSLQIYEMYVHPLGKNVSLSLHQCI